MVDIYLFYVVFLACISAGNSVICTDYTRHGSKITFTCEEACCTGQFNRYCCTKTHESETLRLVTLSAFGLMLLVPLLLVIICALRKYRGGSDQIDQQNTAVQQDTSSVFSIHDATDSCSSSDGFNKVGLMQALTMTAGSPAYLQAPIQSPLASPPKYSELFVPPPYEETNNSPSTSN